MELSFFLLNIVISENLGDYKEFKPIEEFSLKASIHKIPVNNSKIELETLEYVTIISELSRKKMIDNLKLGKGKFGKKKNWSN